GDGSRLTGCTHLTLRCASYHALRFVRTRTDGEMLVGDATNPLGQLLTEPRLNIKGGVLQELVRDTDDLGGVHIRPQVLLPEGRILFRHLGVLIDNSTHVPGVVSGRDREIVPAVGPDNGRPGLTHPTV